MADNDGTIFQALDKMQKTAASVEDSDKKLDIGSDSYGSLDEMLLKPIEEEKSECLEADILVKGLSLRLGQPTLRTSFVEEVDLLRFMGYESDSKGELSPHNSIESPALIPIRQDLLDTFSDANDRSESVLLISAASVTSVCQIGKVEVMFTPKRKSIRISQTKGDDMPRISLRLSEKLVLNQSNPREDYHIKELLGAGSFGNVRRAINKNTTEEVAIKRIMTRKLDKMNRALLENEIRILRQIKHDGVVCLYESCETQKYIWLIMELCTGGDVFDWVEAEEHLDELRAAGVMLQIISTVNWLHGRCVVHRDLKLENILIAKQRPNKSTMSVKIKIADFGFATTIKTQQSLIEGTCGSLNYVAPEVLTGRPYTKACDLWSVGVILYTMLAGFLPFYEAGESGSGRAKTFRRIQQGIYDFDERVWSEVSDLAKSVVTGLLTVNVPSRLTGKQVAKHQWIRSCSAASTRSSR